MTPLHWLLLLASLPAPVWPQVWPLGLADSETEAPATGSRGWTDERGWSYAVMERPEAQLQESRGWPLHHRRHHHRRRRRRRDSNLAREDRRHPSGRLMSEDKPARRREGRAAVELELAVSRLRILESLDNQLREFSLDLSAQIRGPLVCQLRLQFGRPVSPAAAGRPADCLAERRLASHVPPYMLNLHRQLLEQSSSAVQAVRLMPYQSLVMRSFRQPAIISSEMNKGRQALNATDQGYADDQLELVVELSPLEARLSVWPRGEQSEPSSSAGWSACDPGQRLLAAEQRPDLCYHFHLADPIREQISGERLVEAELHLFKLAANESQLVEQVNGAFHLKTNLLEVSLYQILPRPTTERNREPLLRLLDIRRIDLYSSGWETFYVKRALDDWLADADSNLGLVIKAKSMFNEPIRVGLIRFADLYDHPGRPEPEVRAFDRVHQPILVIYTSPADLEPRAMETRSSPLGFSSSAK